MATRRSTKKRSTAEDGRSLAEYRRKRDFERTREPEGQPQRSGRRRNLEFVIQKHAASHLHYDLRLELDGVMLSWAVPKGPSLDPSVKRLAMQVEDHPIEYNTFEGTIPKGEYGGGTVMLWDRGTYSPDDVEDGETAESAVRRGIRSGKLSITFHGERLHGSFALVRTERGAKPKWLLIKHRDADARAAGDITHEVRTSVATGRTMQEIAAEADRVWRSNRGGSPGGEEPGAREPSADDVVIAPMRPHPQRSMPPEGDWSFEPWRGGQRVLAYVTADGARVIDESGSDVTRKRRAITDELASLATRVRRAFVLDGEIADVDGSAVFFASDLLLDGEEVLLDSAWAERRAALESLFRRRRVRQVRLQPIDRRADTMLRRAEREGWPGILARRDDAPYQPGVRSEALLRIAVH